MVQANDKIDPKEVVMVLVGHKIDLKRVVSKEKGEYFAKNCDP